MSHSTSSQYPDSIDVALNTEPRRYTRQRERACLLPGATLPDATVVGKVSDDRALVEASETLIESVLEKEGATPSYALDDGPVSFIPTGRIFVRFERHVDVSALDQLFADSGYRLAQTHSHFRFAGWLRSASGSDADALVNLSKLNAIDDLQSCEPEMLSVRATRE